MFRVRRFAVHAVLPALLIVSAAAMLIGQVRSVAEAAVFPELPRVYLDTTYALPTGPTITVPPGGDFQAALNSAQPGSVIVLTAGATYAGNFTLPNKTGTGWIYIQSSALSSLPAPGTRVSPAQASLMPRLLDTSGNPALHELSNESHGLLAQNGPGPYKIANNEIQAAGETLMFTQQPYPTNLVPADIEIRGNHLFKPLTWLPGNPAFAGISWAVKNNFEVKNAARVLIDGNVFENNWVGVFQPQDGFAVAFTVAAGGSHTPLGGVQNVTFTPNIFQHSSAGIQFRGNDVNYPAQTLQRILIQDNLFVDIGAFPMIYNAGRLFQISDGGADYTFDHNTAFHIEDPLYAQTHAQGYWPATGFSFTNNIAANNAGICGDATGCNVLSTLNTYFSGYVFARTAMTGGTGANYPANNLFPVSWLAVGFVNYTRGDYHLAPARPYKNAGTHGKNPRAHIHGLPAATPRAITRIWTSTPIPSVSPPSTRDFGNVPGGA